MCLTHLQYCRHTESIKSYDTLVCILDLELEFGYVCCGFVGKKVVFGWWVSRGMLGFLFGLLLWLGAWFLVL